jgi:5-methyltetrahydropteroyltriglutamate--homocysteine methyltransferase
MSRSTVYRADVVGSLLRPEYLKEARAALMAGAMQPEDYRPIEDRAADEAIALQEELGLPVVNDGEVRRVTFIDQLLSAVDGVGPAENWKSA